MPSEQEGDGGEKDGEEFFHSFALSINKKRLKNSGRRSRTQLSLNHNNNPENTNCIFGTYVKSDSR
jgi:hypothetical protein